MIFKADWNSEVSFKWLKYCLLLRILIKAVDISILCWNEGINFKVKIREKKLFFTWHVCYAEMPYAFDII